MKTLIVVPWVDEVGGVVSVVNNLGKYFRARGHEVFFFVDGSNLLLKRSVTRLGFTRIQLRLNMPLGESRRRVLRTLAFPFLFILGIVQLVWFIQRQRIQIINVQYPFDHCAYFAICRSILRIPLVTSLHGGDAFPDGKTSKKYSLA